MSRLRELLKFEPAKLKACERTSYFGQRILKTLLRMGEGQIEQPRIVQGMHRMNYHARQRLWLYLYIEDGRSLSRLPRQGRSQQVQWVGRISVRFSCILLLLLIAVKTLQALP